MKISDTVAFYIWLRSICHPCFSKVFAIAFGNQHIWLFSIQSMISIKFQSIIVIRNNRFKLDMKQFFKNFTCKFSIDYCDQSSSDNTFFSISQKRSLKNCFFSGLNPLLLISN